MRRNLRLLYASRGLTAALVSIPVIVPFWQSRGLSQTQIFLLQSAFALSVVVCEVPSGWFADRFGRRTSILAGSVLMPLAFVVYSVAAGFPGMLLAEIVAGIGVSFVSGADSALAYDSLLTLGQQGSYRRFEAVTFTYTGVAEAVASVAGGLLAIVSLAAPILAQVAVYSLLFPVALLLTEPPRREAPSGGNALRDVLRVTRYALSGHREIKWLIFFAAVLGTLTYTMVWLTQPFYQLVGVPLGWFGVLWALQLLSTAVFARFADRFERRLGRRAALVSLLGLGVAAYVVLGAFGSAWVLPVVLVFYFVRAVQTPLLNDYVNVLVHSDIRATVLSVKNLAARGLYVVAGPLIGVSVDAYSLQAGLLLSAALYAALGLVVLGGMRRSRIL